MSVYPVNITPSALAAGVSPAGTYATVRVSTAATTTPGTTANVGQVQVTNYTCSQVFLTVDTSAIPAGQASIALVLESLGTPNPATDVIEVREVTSTSNMISGDSLASFTLLGSASIATGPGRYTITLNNISSMSRSATTKLLLHSQKQRTNVAPTSPSEALSIGTLTHATKPYLNPDPSFVGPWSIVGVGSVAETTTTTLTLTEPAGVQPGDLLVWCMSGRQSTGLNQSPPAGWTKVQDTTSSGNWNTATNTSAGAAGYMYYQVRGASAPTLSLTISNTVSVFLGRIIAYRGNVATTPLDANTAQTTTTAGATTAVSVAGLTTTQEDDLIVAMTAGGQEAAWSSFNATSPSGASGATDTTTAPSATWRERADSNTLTGADTSLGIFDAVKTTAGATGNLTATASLGASHAVVAGAFKMLPPATADAWSAADKTATLTLSNSDKTATAGSGLSGVRSTTARLNGSAGKYYAEFLINAFDNASALYVGTLTLSANLDAEFGAFHVDLINDCSIEINGSSSGLALGPSGVTDIISMAWDAGSEKVWFRLNNGTWNGTGANPASGTGGLDASAIANVNLALWMFSSAPDNSITVRTELAEYTQSVPSGFTSWMGETPATGNVTVNVTGQAIATAVGTVTVATVASADVPVTGQAIATTVGTVTAIGRTNISTTLTGQAIAAEVGTVTVAGKANTVLTGLPLATAVGTVTVNAIKNVSSTLTGQQLSTAVGDVTVSTVSKVDVLVQPTGQALTTALGTASATGQVGAATIVGGQALAMAVGSVTASIRASPTVSGLPVTVAVGSVTVTGKANVPVTTPPGSLDEEIYVIPGTVTVIARIPVSTTLTGQAIGVAVGNVSVSAVQKVSVPVTGEPLSIGITGVTVQAGGSISTGVTGQVAAVSVGDVTVRHNLRTTVSGQAIGAVVGSVTSIGKANVSLTGQALATTVGTATATGQTAASTTLTGQTIGISVGSVTVIARIPVAALVTGQAIATQVGTVTPRGKALVPLTGEALSIVNGGVSVAAGGSVSIPVSGQELTISLGQVTVKVSEVVPIPPSGGIYWGGGHVSKKELKKAVRELLKREARKKKRRKPEVIAKALVAEVKAQGLGAIEKGLLAKLISQALITELPQMFYSEALIRDKEQMQRALLLIFEQALLRLAQEEEEDEEAALLLLSAA